MYYITDTRNDKDQVGAHKQAYIDYSDVFDQPQKISNTILVNTPPAHLTVKAQVYITGTGGLAHAG